MGLCVLAIFHFSPVMDTSLKTLADFTTPALMVPNLENRDPQAVIREMSSVLQQTEGLSDGDAFCDAVMTRELMSPTAMSPGFALPHARLAGLSRLSFSLARSFEPLIWFGESTLRVQIVFLFAVPEEQARNYLNVISAVAKLSQNPALVRGLMHAPDARGMFEVLKRASLRQPRASAHSRFNVLSLEAEYPVI
jgi:mannitol/fructose-specific phosphotransferase system IIA component (Ntr-type)